MDRNPRPVHIKLAELTPRDAATAPTRVRIARIITRAEHQSELTQGVCWMEPGEQTNRWSSREEFDPTEADHWYGPVDETYYVIRGRLRLTWDEGVFELEADDTVYLAPGWTYHLENVGDEPAFFVYNMTPAQE
ncbi:cupin domain-containing protein [Leucobacter luti]|uniref:Cupin domain n=1 Tax=Leucobacter luti TaxID=340320 RepID=A0A4V6MC02_9MICO|nr:cupin domain-containing protein [Leucobacter luti]MBL3699822.1 cupin domain-containing protein [Leucobacter luti]RZT62859.1 cupin domain [Leucobacter luti]